MLVYFTKQGKVLLISLMTHYMLFIVSVFNSYNIHIPGMKPLPLLVLDTVKSLVMAANQSEMSELT